MTVTLLVKPDPALYFFINQGCLTVDGIDDPEEMKGADVCKQVLFDNTPDKNTSILEP